MAKRNIKVDFDKENDMLHLSSGGKVKFSFDVELPQGDIIVDFGFNGKVVGLEFFNASSYFPFLRRVKDQKINADMKIQHGRNWAQIHYKVFVPGMKPISNILISPYNKELVLEH